MFCVFLSTARIWWLLFPEHGLAIRLVHGTCVSWDGRWAGHCTAVQVCEPGVHLLSFFVGVRDGVRQLRLLQDEFMMAVRARASGGMLASLPLGLDELVWVKWVVAGCWRRRTGKVVGVSWEGVSVDLDLSETGSETVFYRWERVAEMVVHAGAITRADEAVGASLVGSRVKVYWPGEERCFDGQVVHWDGKSHHVEYDDGEVVEEVLPSEDTTHWCVL